MTKIALLLLFAFALEANQEKRVELLALEIQELQRKYKSCTAKLLSYNRDDKRVDESLFKECKQKNLLVTQKIHELQKRVAILEKENENLKIQIKKQKKVEKQLHQRVAKLQKKEPKKTKKCQRIVKTVVIKKSQTKQHLELTKDGFVKIVHSN